MDVLKLAAFWVSLFVMAAFLVGVLVLEWLGQV
jgi:hypothetical protein